MIVVLVLLAMLAAAVLAAAVPATRVALLRAAGRLLVASDPVTHADAVVISVDSGGAGVLEAADLVREGVAPRIEIFEAAPGAAARELSRRGVPYYDAAVFSERQLRELGIRSVEIIPHRVEGTSDAVRFLPGWCVRHGFHTIIWVATSDHSRRSRRELARAMRGHDVRVLVRAARYSSFDPDTWWHSTDGARIELSEAEKLMIDVVLHPLS